MNTKTKWVIAVTIGIIVVIGWSLILGKSHLPVPEVKQLSSIEFIKVVNNQGVENITISKPSDINNLLDILKNSKKTNKYSVSDFPDETEFTIIRFNLLEGPSWRSIYKESDDIYVDQPYFGVFRLKPNDFDLFNEIVESGNKKSISMPVDDIFKNEEQ